MEAMVHQGRNIKKLREMLGIKQEALAYELGEDWNQKKVSLLEQKEIIDLPVLEKISAILNIPVEIIKNFDSEQGINNVISNTFNEGAYFGGHASTFNIHPLSKIIEFHAEKMALYERMLEEKELMIKRLEALLNK